MTAADRFSQRQMAMLKEMGVPMWRAPWVESPQAAREELPKEMPSEMPLERPLERSSGQKQDRQSRPESLVTASSEAPHLRERGEPRVVVPEPSAAKSPKVDTAGMDWPVLTAAVAACQACGLSQGRTQTVFGVGSTRAHWMVIGEAPGEQEDLTGEPFVGAAGQLLDQMLRAAHLTRNDDPALDPRQQVYIANTLKCRPPRNRNPERSEMERCEPFLVRQIELVQPKVILAMGRFAVQALLRTEEAIGKLRGRVHRYQGVPLIVTYHPAYLLRNLPDKAKAWEDLCLALDTMEALGAGSGPR